MSESGFHWVPIDLTGSMGGWIIIGLVLLMFILLGYGFYIGWKNDRWRKEHGVDN